LEEPNRIVGELLQPGGVQALEQLGLRDCLCTAEDSGTHNYNISFMVFDAALSGRGEGGVAIELGCALAVALGNQGRSVILLEKSLEEPNRIVGELLYQLHGVRCGVARPGRGRRGH
jgi:2-polyprenyl-6-methoxyphenol hydroxylase-like FAD-dependent oxidoreductase